MSIAVHVANALCLMYNMAKIVCVIVCRQLSWRDSVPNRELEAAWLSCLLPAALKACVRNMHKHLQSVSKGPLNPLCIYGS